MLQGTQKKQFADLQWIAIIQISWELKKFLGVHAPCFDNEWTNFGFKACKTDFKMHFYL